ncbi:Exportin-5-like [Homarus americanus]|uniref:Exportin-5-like n=1 Tax=Homarus americanus TaxID=6706 RepID=A0A8J5TC39_HOMAM|nr:Exportin-5-like [Homarus americanus]
MEVPPQVIDVAGQLAQAVNTTLDPKVKEESELAVGCGFHLAHRDKEPVVRHLGLQLLEHVIKYKWNDLSVQQKVYIKESTMQLVAEGTLDLLSEHLYVKDKVSRLVVEMMKREWPQQWPGLLEELHLLSKRGPTQTELVLFVFLRIAEDVATLQNLESNQRRRDLYQAMTANMESMFGFFLSLLEENFTQYETKINQQDSQTAHQHCRVMQVVLMTLTVYVEWVSMQYIFSENGKLLQSLCFLLSQDNLKMEAAECLLQIVSRKGKPDERRPLLLLFGEELMSAVFNAADQAVMGTLSEHNYRFLKTLTQVLTALGSQLCALWGKEAGVNEPPNFRVYLDAMLAFTRHPSLHIYNFTNGLWGQLFRHEYVPKSETLQAILPSLITIVSRKVMKHGYPSKNDSESCQYSRLDFDSDEEYSHFFYKVRAETLDIIKSASLLAPETMYAYVEEWLIRHVKKAIDTGSCSEKQLCNLFSPSYLEWDALSQVVESVMSRVMQSNGCKPTAESGLQLLRLCLSYETTDPLILSTLLSCISGLFVFIRLVPTVLPDVLNKIFSALTFSLPGQTKDSRSRAVKNVRRHGCSLMVKIARGYPDILLEAFDFINGVVDSLSHNPLELSQMEKVTLYEALMIINNHFYNFDKQSCFISKVLSHVSVIWIDMKQPFSSPLDFMSFVGLDKAPVEPSENDVNGQNRAQIIYCVNLTLAVIKRSEFPSDTDKAEHGGFVLERTENGLIVCRNPATPHVMPLFHQLFCLLRLFNSLWHTEALASVSPGYAKAHNLPETEKNNILGLATSNVADPCIDSPKVQQPLERMQFFLSMMHDNCYHILGNAGVSLGLQFYQHPHLSDYLIHSSLANLHLIPDYRLRPIIRTFLKPFVQWCPPQCYQAVLLPILNHLCPYMLERLSTRWGHLTSLIESGSYEEENTDTQEMLEDLLIRMLTREYVDLLKVVLIGGPRGGWQDNADGMEAEMEVPMPTVTSAQETLSELGQLVLGCDTICQAIVTTLLKVLWWQDSGACLKSVGVVGQVLRWLVGEGQHLSPEAVRQVMLAVLQGLNTHGQHDANQSALLSLGLATYEMFRPHFPNIREVLLGLPGVSADDVQRFEEKLQSPSQNPNVKNSKVEKIKKDVFKKLVIEIVGRSVGQAFKKEVHMNDLPPMFKNPRPKQPRVDDTDTDIGLCSLFGPDSGDSNGHQVVPTSF